MTNVTAGEVGMESADAPWGDYFGSFTDRYGVPWMINHQSEEQRR